MRQSGLQRIRMVVPIGIFLIVSNPAFAHAGLAGAGDFWNGGLHPILDPVQGLTLLALGIGLARTRKAGSTASFHVYKIGFAGAMGLTLVLPPSSLSLGSIGLVAVGILLIDPWGKFTQTPCVPLGVTVIVTGSMFGFDIPDEVSRVIFALGTCISALLITVYTEALWEKFYRPWFLIAARIIGSWLIAIGIMVLGTMLAS